MADQLDFTVAIVCYRYLNRLKVSLPHWLKQTHESYEVIIASPVTDDGTRDYVRSLMPDHPRLRLIETDEERKIDKGHMLNQMAQVGRGKYIVLTDADCVFPRNFLRIVNQRPPLKYDIVYCARKNLTPESTEQVLRGEIDLDDPRLYAHDAKPLKCNRSPSSISPCGFCQIMLMEDMLEGKYGETGSFTCDMTIWPYFFRNNGRFVRMISVNAMHMHHGGAINRQGPTQDY